MRTARLLAFGLLAACEQPSGPAGTCDLTSAAPFGARLGATFEVTDVRGKERGTQSPTIDVYFPDGRRAGARVVFAVANNYPQASVNWTEAQLDSNANVSKVQVSGFASGGFFFTVGLDGSRAPATFSINLAEWGTDVSDTASGEADLTCLGPVPEPTLAVTEQVLSPLSRFSFASSVPPAADTFAVTATANGSETPMNGGVFGGRYSLAPMDALPPNADVQWTLAKAKDVLGRDFAAPSTWPAILRTTATFDGARFDTDVPGAVATSVFSYSITDAHLRLDAEHARGLRLALVALGERPASTARASIAWRIEGCNGNSDYFQLALVGAAGETWDSRFGVRCDAPTGTKQIRIDGTGPIWLAVDAPAYGNPPQWGPGGPLPSLVIDAVTFEQTQ